MHQPPAVPPLAWVLGVPAVLVTLFALIVVAGERAGREPLSYGRPTSLAEAAARANLPELARLRALGQEPGGVYPMRPSYTDFGVSAATLSEAAVLSKNVAAVQYVERIGLPADTKTTAALLCLARDIGADDVTRYLAPRAPATQCTPGTALATLRARTN